MCNRFALPSTPEEVAEHFDLDRAPELSPRYNIAPGESILVVRGAVGSRLADRSSWGLLPGWVCNPRKPLPNVRAETLRDRAGESAVARVGRCLVPAGGFYEWRRLGRARQPYYFQPENTPLFSLAAISEPVSSLAGPASRCAIVTTEPNTLVAPLHDRMPVVIPREAYDLWLDPRRSLTETLSLLAPYPAGQMKAHPVASLVNRTGVDDPRCIEPVAPMMLF